MRTVVTLVCALLVVTSALAQEAPPPALGILLRALSKTEDSAAQLNLLRGINAALKGRRNVAAPPEWAALSDLLSKSTNPEVREQAQTLGAVFGSTGAFAEMRKITADRNAEPAAREKALESLVAGKDPETLPLLLELVNESGPLRRAALRALPAYDDERIVETLLRAYPSFDTEERRDTLAALLARTTWARALVTAVEKDQIPVADLSAPHVRQLRNFKDEQIDAWLKRHPTLMISSADKQAEIARYKTFLTPATVQSGDAARGRALYAQVCASCHVLFGTGGNIGPELTGANRADIDYLLQNILDPNAFIGKDYQSTTVETNDGRILVGMVRGDDANTLTLKTLGEAVIVPKGDVKSVAVSEVSMMPEGLLSALKQDEARDLFTYLASPRQTAILATSTNAADFFNGSDLSRWRASNEVWRVENGELIGRGNAQRAESLVSEMAVENFKLTAQIKVIGEKAVAEIAFRGRRAEDTFRGSSLSFGGAAPVNVFQYDGAPESVLGKTSLASESWHACEITVAGPNARIVLDGAVVFDHRDFPGGPRHAIGFYVLGQGAELRVKDLKLDVLP